MKTQGLGLTVQDFGRSDFSMEILKRAVLYLVAGLLVLMTFRITFLAICALLAIPFGFDSPFPVLYSIFGAVAGLIYFPFSKAVAARVLRIRPFKDGVGIYDNAEVSAISLGASRESCLIAVSSGAVEKLSDENLKTLIERERARVACGEAVTMTLLQSLMNAYVFLPAFFLGHALARLVPRSARPAVRLLTDYGMQIAIALIGAMFVCRRSRESQFISDRAARQFVPAEKLIQLLRSIENVYGHVDDRHSGLTLLKFSGHSSSGWANFLATHPLPNDRISRLEESLGISPDQRLESHLWKEGGSPTLIK
jgi:Zn-dependent protease with chaperone function